MGVVSMTAGSHVVKLTAKTALKNNWLKCIFACLSPIFCFFVLVNSASYVSYISNDAAGYAVLAVMLIFILMPLLLGTVRFFWRMIFGAEDRQAALFYYFSDRQKYKRAVHMAAAIVLRGIGFGIILFFPALILDIFSVSFSTPPSTARTSYREVNAPAASTKFVEFVIGCALTFFPSLYKLKAIDSASVPNILQLKKTPSFVLTAISPRSKRSICRAAFAKEKRENNTITKQESFCIRLS